MKKIGIALIVLLMLTGNIVGKGEWEIGFHYSYWSINLLKPVLEEAVKDSFDSYDANKGDILFDSNGNNMGFELRYYPGGKLGSFSIGLSYERNNFKGDLTGSYEDTIDGVPGTVEAVGYFDLKPHSFNINFRWDIAPRYRFHPFIGIGFGFGRMDGIVSLATTGTAYNGTVLLSELEEKTLKQLLDEYEEEEGKKFPVGFFPIVYFSVGMKGEIANNLYLSGEVAIYDGLIFRGGLAFRF